MAKDKRKGKKRKKLVKQLKEKINLKVAERTVLLEQLALLDARIDEVDEFIVKIDKKIPPLVDEINNAADAIISVNETPQQIVFETDRSLRIYGHLNTEIDLDYEPTNEEFDNYFLYRSNIRFRETGDDTEGL